MSKRRPQSFFIAVPLVLILSSPVERVLAGEFVGKNACPLPDNRVINLEALTPYIELIQTSDCKIINANRKAISSEQHGKISYYWSQNAVGVLEMDRFIRRYDREHRENPTSSVNVGVIDRDFHVSTFDHDQLSGEVFVCKRTGKCPTTSHHDDHGTRVAHLIVDAPPAGMGTRAKLRQFENSNRDFAWAIAAKNFLKVTPPQVINLSVTIQGNSEISKELQQDINAMVHLAESTILVQSIGNSFPRFKDSDMEMKIPSIRVGSLEPTGLSSLFSAESESTVISAPAGRDQMTHGAENPWKFWRKKKSRKGGGTSGAAPLVTGAIANVISFLPHLTKSEAVELLKQTAIPIPSSTLDSRKVNGPGSLNAYKMVRVAARLKEDWPNNRNNLKNPALYNFETESLQLFRKAKKLLERKSDCTSLKNAFSLLREAFFLSPNNREIRAQLAEFYQNEGFEAESLFYRHPKDSSLDPRVIPKLRARKAVAAVALGDLRAFQRATYPYLNPDEPIPPLRTRPAGAELDRYLSVAALYYHPDIIEHLIKNNVNLKYEDNRGENALSYAIIGTAFANFGTDRDVDKELVRKTIRLLVSQGLKLPRNSNYIKAFKKNRFAGLGKTEYENYKYALELLKARP